MNFILPKKEKIILYLFAYNNNVLKAFIIFKSVYKMCLFSFFKSLWVVILIA